jgi:uncharacterized protein
LQDALDNARDGVANNTAGADLWTAEALYRLGGRYDNGTGVAKNEGEAMRYYQLAADQGHPDA